MDAHGRLVTAIFLTGPDVEADRRPDAHAFARTDTSCCDGSDRDLYH